MKINGEDAKLIQCGSLVEWNEEDANYPSPLIVGVDYSLTSLRSGTRYDGYQSWDDICGACRLVEGELTISN